MRVLSFVVVFLLGACSVALEPSDPPLGREFEVEVGETARLDEGRLSITFQEVPSDSRCPIDAVCVRAGEAVVTVALSTPGREASTVALEIPSAQKSTATYGEYRVELLRLLPAPRAGTTRTEPYVATLRVTRE